MQTLTELRKGETTVSFVRCGCCREYEVVLVGNIRESFLIDFEHFLNYYTHKKVNYELLSYEYNDLETRR